MAYTLITFSPTGGTAKAAEILARAVFGSWQTIDLLKPVSDIGFGAADVCLAAVPSFGGRVPTAAAERLRFLHGDGTRVILLCVYGNRAYEDTLSELQDLLEEQGFVCTAAAAAVAEHSVLREFAAGRPDAADCAELTSFGERIRERLEHPVCRPLTIPGSHGTYKPFTNSVFVPAEDSRCVSCGRCAAECPTGAIGRTPSEIDPTACIKCMRCTAVCPTGARRHAPELLEPLRQRLSAVCGTRKANELFL